MQKLGKRSPATRRYGSAQPAVLRPQPELKAVDFILTSELEGKFEYYLSLFCYNHSEKTKGTKRDTLKLFTWFLQDRGLDRVDRLSIAAFLGHVTNGHLEPNGRYGLGPTNERYYKPTSARTPQLYYTQLQSFFNALVIDRQLDESPLERIARPQAAAPSIEPFSLDNIERLAQAARRSHDPLRNEAIVWLMFDTGLRSSEVCALKHSSLDMVGHHLIIENGKGNKRRVVKFGDAAAQALLVYLRQLREAARDGKTLHPNDPLFPKDKRGTGQHLKPDGLRQLFYRLGRAAGISGVRCSPHTMRHSFATSFLVNGGSQRAAMAQMGHTDVKMTVRYQNLAEAQLSKQHADASPADRLRRKGSR